MFFKLAKMCSGFLKFVFFCSKTMLNSKLYNLDLLNRIIVFPVFENVFFHFNQITQCVLGERSLRRDKNAKGRECGAQPNESKVSN